MRGGKNNEIGVFIVVWLNFKIMLLNGKYKI